MSLRTRIASIVIVASAMLPVLAVAQASLDELARDVDRAESLRTVKNLQRTYAQYAQYGLWNEMADLFAINGTFIFDDQTIKGKQAIAEYLVAHEGNELVIVRVLLCKQV